MRKFLTAMAVLAVSLCLVTRSFAFFIDFEEGFGQDQQPIINITGVTFEVTGGYNWIYGDSTTGNWNTNSIDLNYGSGGYQHYGNVFAFLGTDNNAGSGKIDFTNNDGTWFQAGYTVNNSNFYLEGYDINDNLIASTSGGVNYGGADMTFLRIDAPSGQFFDYVVVHDTGNYFLIDNISGDSTGIPSGGDNNVIPEPASMSLLGLGLTGLIGWRKRKISA